jgi:hypothetical protein
MTRIVAALVAVVTAALVAAAPGLTTAKDGRGLDAEFGSSSCGPASALPIKLDDDSGGPISTLRPGSYWITLTDNCPTHNFVLNDAQVSNGDGQVLTGPLADTPGTVTFKILLKHGSYRLYCGNPNHRNMFVDFEVGGVGQTG